MHRLSALVAILALLVLSGGCASQRGARQVLLDTPAQHVSNGIRLLDAGKPADARREFELAKLSNAGYAGAFVGLSVVDSRTGHYKRAGMQLEEAEKLAREDWERSQIEIARMELHMNQEAPGWLGRVETAYTRATSLTPHAPRATHTLAMAYLKAKRFDLARVRFDQVSNTDDSLAFTARAGRELCDQVLEAQPATELGRDTALIRSINRAEMAALLVAEVDLEWPDPQSNTPATDLSPSLPQAEAINIVLTSRLPGFPLAAGGAFMPPLLVKRQDLALIALGVVQAASGLPGLDAGCFVPGLTDLPANDEYAEAICFVLARGLMDRVTWSRFEPQATVSGAMALLTLHRSQKLGLRLKELTE